MLVHEHNLERKEADKKKYGSDKSKGLLAEIRPKYSEWHAANASLIGPTAVAQDDDEETVRQRVNSFGVYKNFIDAKKYATHFNSKSNLHSSVLEQFIYYLFRDLAGSFGAKALIGKSHSFKDIFFDAASFKEMLESPHVRVEKKDHDFVIGATIANGLSIVTPDPSLYDAEAVTDRVKEAQIKYAPVAGAEDEQVLFDIPAVAIECKTYLDKTMLEACSRSAEQLKAKCPNAKYIVVMEWLKLSENINLRKYEVDQIYVFRRQKNTDQEYRFDDGYAKNPIDPGVVWHLFKTVREHLTSDWEGGVARGLERGWLI